MKRKRGRPKKAVVKNPTPPPAPKPAAQPPPSPPLPGNTDVEAFLSFVGQNVNDDNPGLGHQFDHADDNGFGQYDSEIDSSSSSSSGESNELDFAGIYSNDDSDGPVNDRRGKQRENKNGRPKKVKTLKRNDNAAAFSSSKLLGYSSRKEGSLRSQAPNPVPNLGRDPRLNKKELKTSLEVIQKVMEMDEAVPFNTPVDPVAQGIPDYFTVIDTPMDFGTICSNLQNGVKYLNSEDVYKDVQHIWENCHKYNKKGDYIVYLMKRVKKKFMKYWTAAGLHSEVMTRPGGHSLFAPSGDHAMRHNRHQVISVVNCMASNLNPIHQDNFGSCQPQPQVPLSSYAKTYQSYQPQQSTAQMPQFSKFHAAVDNSYAGRSHITGPPVNVFLMEKEKHRTKRSIAPVMSGPTHYQQQQPQPSSRHWWQSQQSTGQPQPSKSRTGFGADVNNTGNLPLSPPMDCAMTHNGCVSRCSEDPMFSSMNQPQPQHHLLNHYPPNESHQPQASIGQPQPSQPLASVDISSAGMAQVDASMRGRRHTQRYPSGPEAEIPLMSGHSSPQQLVVSRNHPLSTHETKSRVRGPTRCRFMLDIPDGERIFVPINTLGQPVGPEASKLASFLGTIARNGKMAPLNFLDWSAMPDAKKEDVWQFVQTKFDIDPLCKTWVMKSLASKWRNWKAKLKADHYNPHTTDEERLKDCNKRVLPDQWAALVAHWNSEEVQLRCAKNKANRAKQKSAHAAGSKSFARIREEERAKRPDGKEPTRGELYIITRTRKDGQPVDKTAAEVISKLRQQATEKQPNSHGSNDDEDLCPTLSDLWGRKPSRNSLMRMAFEAKRSANEEVSKMLNKMEAMEQKYASLEEQIARMNANMQNLINKIGANDVCLKQVPNKAPEDSLQAKAHSSSSSHAVRSDEVGDRQGVMIN